METENSNMEQLETNGKKVLDVEFVDDNLVVNNNVVEDNIIVDNPVIKDNVVIDSNMENFNVKNNNDNLKNLNNHKKSVNIIYRTPITSLYFGYKTRLFLKLGLFLIFAIISIISFSTIEKNIIQKTSNYQITANSDYKVYLLENNYYNTNVLDSNMKYVADLIDKIEFNYDYNFYSPDNYNLKYSYYITSKLLISDSKDKNKILYEDEKVVVDKVQRTINGKGFKISDKLDINYSEFDKVARDFKNTYNLYASSQVLYTLYVDVVGTHNGIEEKIVEKNQVNLTIPLSEKTFEIKLDNNEININDKISGTIVEKGKNNFKLVVGIIFGVLALGSLVLVILFILKTMKKTTKYEQRVNQLLKEYDRAIAKTKEVIEIRDEHNLIEIDTFEGLLDIRDNLNLPILFMEVHKGSKAWFIIKKDNDIYRYVLKGVDLGDNKK